jgi:hypothetical protein
MTRQRSWLARSFAVICLMSAGAAVAEPYFAVREGMMCSSCHVAASGGGMRTALGNAWAQAALPARRIDVPDADSWTGAVNRYLSVGGNARVGASYVDVPNADAQSQFEVEEVRAYLGVNIIPGRLLLYADQRVAPGSSTNLEAYVRYSSADQGWYVRAGQIYLPYGWRLEDDSAFIRQVTGIGFATPDRGVELGMETRSVSAQLAVTNGTPAGSEADSGKQLSLRAEHVRAAWRFGASFNYNDADAGERSMLGLFAGWRTGPIAWLAEADVVSDAGYADGKRTQWVGLFEGNWRIATGHNLKISSEYFDPDVDVDEDEQDRFSVVWECSPLQFAQLRVGARFYEGIPQNDLQNRKLYFVSVNGFF